MGELTAEEDDGATAALLGGIRRGGYLDLFLASLTPAVRAEALAAEDRAWSRYRETTRNTDPDR